MALTKIKTGSVSDSITLTTPDINGGTIDATVIGGTTPAAATFTTLTANAASTITTADNTTQLTLTSTDADANVGPALDLYRNSGSPADSDRVGIVRFQGENDAGQTVNYAVIETLMTDVTDGTEDAQFDLRTIVAGSEKSRMSMVAAETVINQGSADLDFRVESDGNANMLFVNGGNNCVGIGNPTYDANYQLHVLGSDAVPNVNLLLQSDDAANATSQITMYARNVSAGNKVTNIVNSAGSLIFGTNDGTEKMRLSTGGYLGIGVNPTYPLHVRKDAPSDWAAKIENSSPTNPYGSIVRFSSAAPDNHIRHFFLCSDSAATRLIIQSDGDVQNHDNSYGAISDERVKQDITDASSQWDDIKALRVRNYKMKDDVRAYGDDAKFKLGLISQEAELVSPHIIAESAAQKNDIESSSDFGSLYVEGDTIPEGSEVGDIKERLATVKAIKYSILYMKAIKALQEAQTRIESLETLTESLAARITALEGA